MEKVNHPKHYNSHPSGVECITIVRWFNFNVGNAVKYLWRAGLKPGEDTLADLRKAQWYIEDEITRLEGRVSEWDWEAKVAAKAEGKERNLNDEISWIDAPGWANWYVIDGNGASWLCENEPDEGKTGGWVLAGGRVHQDSTVYPARIAVRWREMKFERPDKRQEFFRENLDALLERDES